MSELVGATFGFLTHARRRQLDLGSAGELLCLALEKAAPGAIAQLDRLVPTATDAREARKGRKPIPDFKRDRRRVAKVHPVKR